MIKKIMDPAGLKETAVNMLTTFEQMRHILKPGRELVGIAVNSEFQNAAKAVIENKDCQDVLKEIDCSEYSIIKDKPYGVTTSSI